MDPRIAQLRDFRPAVVSDANQANNAGFSSVSIAGRSDKNSIETKRGDIILEAGEMIV